MKNNSTAASNFAKIMTTCSLELTAQSRVRRLGKEYSIGEDIVSAIKQCGQGKFYCCQNSVIAFVVSGHYFVTPRHTDKENFLKSWGFKKKEFYVPFCDYSEPADVVVREYWNVLKLENGLID